MACVYQPTVASEWAASAEQSLRRQPPKFECTNNARAHTQSNAQCVLRVQATKAAVAQLRESGPAVAAELVKVEEALAAVQQASQDDSIADEERDALLRRIQALTDREAEASQRALRERQVCALPRCI